MITNNISNSWFNLLIKLEEEKHKISRCNQNGEKRNDTPSVSNYTSFCIGWITNIVDIICGVAWCGRYGKWI